MAPNFQFCGPTTSLLVNGNFAHLCGLGPWPLDALNDTSAGWTVVPDHILELGLPGPYGVTGITTSGCIVEMNVNGPNTWFQQLTLTPLATYTFRLLYAARAGYSNSARVEVGPPGGPFAPLLTLSTASATFTLYGGSFSVPFGQTVTQFRLVSVSGGSVGNIVGDVFLCPAGAGAPAASTAYCSSPAFATPSAQGSCPPVTISAADSTTAGGCAGNYTVVRSWTATDACINTATASQTIVVLDTCAPTFATLQPSTVYAPAGPTGFSTASAGDAFSGVSLSPSSSDSTTQGSCYGNYNVTRTWTVADSCGNTAQASQTISVLDSAGPTFATLPRPTTVDCSATPATFAAPTLATSSSLVSFLSADSTVLAGCAGNYTVARTWTAVDQCGNTATTSQTITVRDMTAPTFDGLPAFTSVEATNLVENGGFETGDFWSWTLSSNSDSHNSVSSYYVHSGTYGASFGQVGSVAFISQTLSTSPGQQYLLSFWLLLPDGTTPNQFSASWDGVIRFSQVNISAPFLWTFHQFVVTATSSGAYMEFGFRNDPAFFYLDDISVAPYAVTGVGDLCSAVTLASSQSVLDACAGSVLKSWTATDWCGNTASTSQTIVEPPGIPTFQSLPVSSTLYCPSAPTFTEPTVSDASFAIANVVSSDATTVRGCAGNYSVVRRWIVQDECGHTASTSQTIDVLDSAAPTFAPLPLATTVYCPDVPTGFAEAMAGDDCDGPRTASSSDSTTPGSCYGNYSVTRTWTVQDECGHTASTSQTINVLDTVAPTFVPLPGTTTVYCPVLPTGFAAATAGDAFNGSLTASSSDSTSAAGCLGNYSVTRTWVATDACGNSASTAQTIVVRDTSPPSIGSLPAPTSIACPTSPTFSTPTALDSCDGTDIQSLASSDAIGFSVCLGSVYSVVRSWTATDHCGFTATTSQEITIADAAPPTISSLPSPSTVACPTAPSFVALRASGSCSAVATSNMDSTVGGGCPGNYNVTRYWTAADACGVSTTTSQLITVIDTMPPTFVALPAASTTNCPAPPSFGDPAPGDSCDGSSLASFLSADSTVAGGCAANYSVTRSWTAVDHCGNSASTSQHITAQDLDAPTFAALPLASIILFPASPTFAQAMVGDSCTGGASLDLSSSDSTTQQGCSGNYSVTRTWTATDQCGNTATTSQQIAVQRLCAFVAPTTVSVVPSGKKSTHAKKRRAKEDDNKPESNTSRNISQNQNVSTLLLGQSWFSHWPLLCRCKRGRVHSDAEPGSGCANHCHLCAEWHRIDQRIRGFALLQHCFVLGRSDCSHRWDRTPRQCRHARFEPLSPFLLCLPFFRFFSSSLIH